MGALNGDLASCAAISTTLSGANGTGGAAGAGAAFADRVGATAGLVEARRVLVLGKIPAGTERESTLSRCLYLARHIGLTHHLGHVTQTALVLVANIVSFAVFWVVKLLIFNKLFHVPTLLEEIDEHIEAE